MNIFAGVLPNFIEIFGIALTFFLNGGWVLVVAILVYVMWRMYKIEIMEQYVHSQEWTFLHFRVPRQNIVSLVGVETIFSQMHALHVGKTLPERIIEGQIQLWYSMEIISMGGKISFFMRIPKRMRDVVESAFYSQYPEVEISESTDYLENFKYDPQKPSDYDIFGSEWKLTDDDVIPIKTYKDFEHPAAEDKIIDPLANFFEGLSKIQPCEFAGFQIIIQPLSDEEWQPRGALKVKKLTEEEIPHSKSLLDYLLAPLNWFANLGSGHGGHAGHDDEKKPRNNWLNMTEAEKKRVTLVEAKIGKQGYKTKLRMLYIAPKGKFDHSKKGLLSGLYRSLGSAMVNKLKPDTSKTWTSADYKISRTLEKSYLEHLLNKKKRFLFKGYKNRDIHIGLPMFILNTEELATLFHFPITTEVRPVIASVEQTASKKSQPPVNLPVPEIILE